MTAGGTRGPELAVKPHLAALLRHVAEPLEGSRACRPARAGTAAATRVRGGV